jgi:hypothetical protein
MGLFGWLRGKSRERVRTIGHIADPPTFMSENGAQFMVFRLMEMPDTEFRLRMFPLTPKRHQGDLVELVYEASPGHAVMVESLLAAPSEEARRRKNREYLDAISEQNARR